MTDQKEEELSDGIQFYFVRHAHTETNARSTKVWGQTPWAEITAKGKEQARLLGERFAKEYGSDPRVQTEAPVVTMFDAIYTSPAVRTQQTLRYCFEKHADTLRYSICPELSEQNQGDWEGNSKDVYKDPVVRESFDKDAWNTVPGTATRGESQAHVAKRMREWLQKIIETHRETKGFSRILVMTHGNSIRCLLADLFDQPRQSAHCVPVENTSVTAIRYTKNTGGFECLYTAKADHLPPPPPQSPL